MCSRTSKAFRTCLIWPATMKTGASPSSKPRAARHGPERGEYIEGGARPSRVREDSPEGNSNQRQRRWEGPGRIDAPAVPLGATNSGQLSYAFVPRRFRDSDAADGSALDVDAISTSTRTTATDSPGGPNDSGEQKWAGRRTPCDPAGRSRAVRGQHALRPSARLGTSDDYARRLVFPGGVAARLLGYASIAAREDGVLHLAARSLARSNAGLHGVSGAERGQPVSVQLGEVQISMNAVVLGMHHRIDIAGH